MSFYIYDITFLVIFTLGVIIFLYRRRHNLKREGIMYLYRTKVGIKFINYIGEKYKRTLTLFSYLAIISGYILMASMVYFLYQILYIYLFRPDIVQAIKIPPLIPLVPYLPEAFNISFLPPFYFTYWIIAIAVIAIFHEFSHGIIARRYGIQIHTTGFGFLGPFLAAFVEPDEKQMESKPKFQQIAVLSAGTFTNLILAVLFFLLLSVFFIWAYHPAGALFNTYTPGLVNISSITSIGGIAAINPTTQDLINIINKNNLTDDLILGSNGNTLKLIKITSEEKTYFMTVEDLKSQLEEEKTEVVLYEDLPAINLGLKGIIVKIDDITINENNDLINAMKEYSVGDTIKITTEGTNKNKETETLIYNLTLAEDPNEEGRAVIGIGYLGGRTGMLGTIADFFNFFKDPATFYEPKFNADFVIFIYNLIWWLALINLSVALINMWPVAIFDGGRMFMLTVWAITGSEKVGKWAFAAVTYLILGALFLLMLGWFLAVF